MLRALWWGGVLAALLMACDDGDAPAVVPASDAAVAADQGLPDLGDAPDEGTRDATAPADLGLPRDAELDLGALLDLGAEPDAEPDAAFEPDAALPPIDPPLLAAPARLLHAPTERVVAVEGGLVADTAEGLIWLGADGALEPLGAFSLSAAARVGAVLLVSDAAGVLLAKTPTGLRPSPVAVPDVGDLAVTGGPTLWIAGDGIYRWLDGVVAPVSVGELPTAEGRLASAWFEGRPVVWVAADDAIYALEPRADDVIAHVTTSPGVATSLAGDARGLAWAIVDGVAWAFDPETGWAPGPTELPLFEAVAADPGAPDVWLLTTDGALWHALDGRFRPVDGVSEVVDLAVRASGEALVANADGVWAVRPGRAVTVEGLPAGPLADAVDVTLRPADPESVRGVSVVVGEAAPEAVPGPPWVWRADPGLLGPGRHRVVFSVAYADGEVARAALTVAVFAPPTWVDDVQPLFEAECAGACHGERGSARRLDAYDAWRSQVDPILDAVRAGRMPLALDPLSPAQIAMIEAWRDAGMPEE